jgi:hypothetical protein
MRCGYPLTYFKTGESNYYVFFHCDGYVEDYKATYDDNKSFIELVGSIIERETTPEYAWKIVKILAKKLGLEKELRDAPLTEDDFLRIIYRNLKCKKKEWDDEVSSKI